jgi:hypothetical protein
MVYPMAAVMTTPGFCGDLSFPMPEKAKYEYIIGIIIVEEQRIVLYKDQEYLLEFPFALS